MRITGKNKNQSGFTMIELVVGMALIGIIGISVIASIAMLYNTSGSTTDDVTVQNEVANAAMWITRDAQMADALKIDRPTGTLIRFQWIEWNDDNSSVSHEVVYLINGDEIERTETIAGGSPKTTVVLQHTNIEPSLTYCDYNPTTQMITFKVTANITRYRTESATSIVKVIPRTSL